MSNVEKFPVIARKLTEYEAFLAAAPSALDAIPCAVYLCDHNGRIMVHNAEAARLWGRVPELAGDERFCGSHKLLLLDGSALAHDACPMATAVAKGVAVRNAELLVERPDGSLIQVLVNIRPLKDKDGTIQGAINCFLDLTEQRRAEGEVLRQHRELEDFFDNGAVGLHIVSNEGIILRANQAELDLLGYSASEYEGRHIAEFHADAPVIGEILHRLSCGVEIDRFPARLRAKDGSIRHVQITSNSRFDGGKFASTRCFTTDVTELHHAEEARRDSEHRLAATYEAATIGITETDRLGRLVRVNDAICAMVGRSREQLLSMTFVDCTHPDDRAEDERLYARQIAGEIDNYTIRKRVMKADGSTIWMDVFGSAVRDADGQFLYGVRALQDVTEAKQLVDQLRANEQQMRDILEALPAAVYTTDAQGNITFHNQATVEMAGREPQAGDQWCVTWRLYYPDGTHMPHDECPMAVALREDRPVRGAEAIAERPDGTRVPFIPFPTPLHDADGKLIGAINMLVDITERKESEVRQKALIDELNHRVKNTLATVQSLAAQTARHSEGIADFNTRFEARLMALARAHDLLSVGQWIDAPLDELIANLLSPMATPGRVQVRGEAISMNPRAALCMTMAINELMTNAAKYGALSKDGGKLSIVYGVREKTGGKRLYFDWKESGGPPVSLPTKRGFGVRLMERCVEGDLAGELELTFGPKGMNCRMSIPIESLSPACAD